MQNLESLVAAQQATINAMKKKVAGEVLSKADTVIIELTLAGKSAPQTQQRADLKIIELVTAGKSDKQ